MISDNENAIPHESFPRLRAEHLGRAVSGKKIVDDVTLDVFQHELLAIVGPSGAGKSSLLRLLNRLDEPTTGTVYLDGKDYREFSTQILRTRIGMVMQRPYLFPGTVSANIRFGPAQRGAQICDDEIASLLQSVGLAGYAASDVGYLSGGEAQRVSLARALANQPSVLLMDEPTSALDENARLEVEAVIRRIQQEKRVTCVLVTHDVAQAKRLAQRLAVLKSGRLIIAGPIDEVLHAQKILS